MKPHITIKDVAKRLNVSISTVSRAFNDKYDIRPETRQLILDTALEMGYHPNPMARKLPQQKSFLLGVVVPEFVNAFFPHVIMGMQPVLFKADYQLLIMSSNESAEQELNIVKRLESSMVDGIFLSLTHQTRDIGYYSQMVERGFPIVQFNRVNYKLETPKVIFDDYRWAVFATEHLIKQGYKKIWHLSGPSSLTVSYNRSKGYVDAMKRNKLGDMVKLLEAGVFIEDGERVGQAIIDKGDMPEALFCFNDPLAIGAIQALKSNGYSIPDDVAMVGFTESRIAPYMTPALTSVMQPAREIGEMAARLMLEMINSMPMKINHTVTLNGVLNIRESSIKLV